MLIGNIIDDCRLMHRSKSDIAIFLKRQRREFHRLSKQLEKDSSPPRIHRLRVCVRRLQSTLWVIEKGLPVVHTKSVKRHLRKVAHRLGEIREIDVGVRDAKNYHLKAGPLKRRRKTLGKSLIRFMSRRRRKVIESKLDRIVEVLHGNGNLEIRSVEHVLRQRWAVLRSKSMARHPDLHRLRIAFKKTRYSFEVLAKPVAPLREVQDVLGRLHDLKVLEQLVGKTRRVKSDQKDLRQEAVPLVQTALTFVRSELQ